MHTVPVPKMDVALCHAATRIFCSF